MCVDTQAWGEEWKPLASLHWLQHSWKFPHSISSPVLPFHQWPQLKNEEMRIRELGAFQSLCKLVVGSKFTPVSIPPPPQEYRYDWWNLGNRAFLQTQACFLRVWNACTRNPPALYYVFTAIFFSVQQMYSTEKSKFLPKLCFEKRHKDYLAKFHCGHWQTHDY